MRTSQSELMQAWDKIQHGHNVPEPDGPKRLLLWIPRDVSDGYSLTRKKGALSSLLLQFP